MSDAPPFSCSLSAPEAGISMTDEFQAAMEVLEAAEEHAFITGRAGTGKSTLLRHFMSKTRRRAVVLAPTGLAAINVGGQTLHSFFKFPPRLLEAQDVKALPWQQKLFASLDTLIIDEISMVRADVLDAVDRSLRINRRRLDTPFGGVQIVAFGDLLQLAPVVEDGLRGYFQEAYETPYFFSARVLRECDWRLMELTKNYRQEQDPDYFDLVSRIGYNDMSEEDFERLNSRVDPDDFGDEEGRVTLTSTNAAAAALNEARLEALEGDVAYYEGSATGEFDNGSFPAEAGLAVKEGAQIIMLRNDPDKRWVNGDIGVVAGCGPDGLRVFIKGLVHEVAPARWDRIRYRFSHEDGNIVRDVAGTFKQYPVRLAWAITIHKSQGQTLKRVTVDLGRRAFAHGQTYVALSRCESLDGLKLRRPIRASDILFDDRVLSFLRRSAVR